MYIRKTYDEFEIQQKTDFGWETVNTELSWTAIRISLKEYQENQPAIYRIKKRRVKKENG